MEILFEDNHLIIVNKKPGEIVQGDRTGDEPLGERIKKYIKEKYAKPGEVFLGTVHRLDRPVSGIVVFARTGKALERMNKMFHDRNVEKTYWAVVKNKPPEDAAVLTAFLKKNEKQNKSYVYLKKTGGALESELGYRLIGKSESYFLMEVNPRTGRHHQIRAMLAHLGCPVKGDLKYGFPRSNKDGSIHLHARKISFTHPVQKNEVTVKADPPDDPVWIFFKSSQ